MRPLILAVADKMSAKEASPSLQFLLSLTVRLVIASTTRSGSVETPLADAAHKVFERTVATCAQLKAELLGLTPGDSVFVDAFELARVSNARIARYYLRSLEMTAKNEAEPWFVPDDDRQIITLEHVLPKKPEGNWSQFTEEEAQQLTNRLGNQVLLRRRDNSELRSQAFIDKRVVYEASPYSLTSQVGQATDWTADAIRDRQKTLAGLAAATWPVR